MKFILIIAGTAMCKMKIYLLFLARKGNCLKFGCRMSSEFRLCSVCITLTQHPQLGRESTCFLLHLSIKRVLRSENTRFSRSRRRSEKQDFHVATSVWLGRQIYAFGYWVWCSSPPCPPFLDATILLLLLHFISGSDFVFPAVFISNVSLDVD